MENLISTIFPTECVFCNRVGPMVCYKCSQDLTAVQESVCIVCQSPSVNGNTHKSCFTKETPTASFSCFEYEGKIRKGIMMSKYPPLLYGALEDLTNYGIKFAFSTGYYLFDYIVVPLPLSAQRYKKRGFNQAKVISKSLAKRLGLKTQYSSLARQKDTVAQADSNREERIKNMRGAFIANPTSVKGRRVLLVDDICTTGATLLSASKALYVAGALDVRCFTLSVVSQRHERRRHKHPEGEAPRNAHEKR
jgi:competence protein ComFC